MLIDWTKNLKDDEEKLRFERQVRSSKSVFERLDQLLNEQDQSITSSEMDITIFDKANWAERQAFNNGRRSAIYKIKKLISLDQEEKK